MCIPCLNEDNNDNGVQATLTLLVMLTGTQSTIENIIAGLCKEHLQVYRNAMKHPRPELKEFGH